MIVVDTNVIAYLYLQGDHTENSEKLLQKDPEWAAPLLWRSEFRNVLASYIRKGLIQLNAAVQVIENAESFLQGREYHLSSEAVLRLAARSKLPAYDCEFVALAQALGISLVTMDAGVLREFKFLAIALDDF